MPARSILLHKGRGVLPTKAVVQGEAMADLPDVVHENAVGVIGVMSQRASRTGLADGTDTRLVGCERCEGKGAARRGIGELPNLAPLKLSAGPERVPPDYVADGISDAVDVFRIALEFPPSPRPV